MNTSLETLLFFTKLLTGLILFLNAALICCIRLTLRTAKEAKVMGNDGKMKGGRMMSFLIFAIIVINGLTVYGNHKMLGAISEMTAQLNHSK